MTIQPTMLAIPMMPSSVMPPSVRLSLRPAKHLLPAAALEGETRSPRRPAAFVGRTHAALSISGETLQCGHVLGAVVQVQLMVD